MLAVDEAHCISHWGFSAKKEEIIFRVWFRRINELQSLARRVPVVALTTTATLEMENAIHVCEIHCLYMWLRWLATLNPHETFQALIDEVRKKGRACPRVIIYCRTIRIVSMISGRS